METKAEEARVKLERSTYAMLGRLAFTPRTGVFTYFVFITPSNTKILVSHLKKLKDSQISLNKL